MVGLMVPFDTHNMRSYHYKSWLSQKSTSTDLYELAPGLFTHTVITDGQ